MSEIELKFSDVSVNTKASGHYLPPPFENVVVHFAGDFGGYFGLLLGGSALSIFEIIDLIIYNAVVKFTTRKIQPNQQPRVINVKSLELEKF